MKKCPSCATKNENHFKYCSNCGGSLKSKQKTDKVESNTDPFLLRNYRWISGAIITLAIPLFLLFSSLIISYGLSLEDILIFRHFDRQLLVISTLSITLLATLLGGLVYYIYCFRRIDPDFTPSSIFFTFGFPLIFFPFPIVGFMGILIFIFILYFPETKSEHKDDSEQSPVKRFSQRYSVNFKILPATILLLLALSNGVTVLDNFHGNRIAHFFGIDTTLEWNGRLSLSQRRNRIVIRDHSFGKNTKIAPLGKCELIFENCKFDGGSISLYGEAKITLKGGELNGTQILQRDEPALFIDSAKLNDCKIELYDASRITLNNSKLINTPLLLKNNSTASIENLHMLNGILKLEDYVKVTIDGMELEERGVMYKDRDLFEEAMVHMEKSTVLNAARLYIIGQNREALICKDESRIKIEKGVLHSAARESLKGSWKAMIMLKDLKVTNTLLRDNSIMALDGSESYQVRVRHNAYLIHKNSELIRKTKKEKNYEGRILQVEQGESAFDLAAQIRERGH